MLGRSGNGNEQRRRDRHREDQLMSHAELPAGSGRSPCVNQES
jgi:hypothetical protein